MSHRFYSFRYLLLSRFVTLVSGACYQSELGSA